MSFDITTSFVNEFKSTIEHLVQQQQSRLRPAVRVEFQKGKTAFYDQLGKVTAQKRTTRHGDTPRIDTPHKRRAVSLVDYEVADLIDRQDMVRTLNDPSNPYVQAFVASLNRTMDDVLIEAALGDAYTGENGDTAVALPTAQKIVADSEGFTLAKLKKALKILKTNEADEDELYVVWTYAQEEEFLGENQVASVDYNTQRVLVDGSVDAFLGFKFIRVERLPITSTTRSCFAFAKSGLLLALGEDVNARITERDDKSYATQVYASMSVGATRMQEEKIVQIDCDE